MYFRINEMKWKSMESMIDKEIYKSMILLMEENVCIIIYAVVDGEI